MIPRIIHQTWKSNQIPDRFLNFSLTWQQKNPDWSYRLWTDRDLLEFVAEHYPDLLKVFCGYRQGVKRADAGRYLLLHHFGGVYADIDTECCQSLEPLTSEDRVILCYEPHAHWAPTIASRGLPCLLFNGVMASPAGHPFWSHLTKIIKTMEHVSNVLDSTGPCVLTSAYLNYPDQDSMRIEDAVFFNPVDVHGNSDFEANDPECYAIHHWAGTWWRPAIETKFRRKWTKLMTRFLKTKAKLTGGKRLKKAVAQASVSQEILSAGFPEGKNLAILVPVRDGSEHIAGFLNAIGKLDVPASTIKLVFCEGDSTDDTYDRIVSLTEPLKDLYREIRILRKNVGTEFVHARRWLPSVQRERRAGLARVRNYLIDEGLDESDDWALWIDVDVWKFPSNIFSRLLEERARIVAPNCVIVPGGRSYDKNSFVTLTTRRDYRYYKLLKGGLFQPPAKNPFRLFLSDLIYSERVPLDGVGGTMLLVDASLHRGGLRFPELPYDDLIETEGFGRLANDCGITPIGLPQVEVLHVPW
jgi:Anp1/Glycosyltransferase sugar-binding region containing DXD motif